MKKTIIFGVLIIFLLGVVFAVFYSRQNKDSRTIPASKQNKDSRTIPASKQNKDSRTIPQDETVTIEDLRAEMISLEKINVYPDNKKVNPEDYPIVLGPYSGNGLILIEKYFCSDVCPDNGEVSIVFQDITSQEECVKVGGKDLIDPAWGGYIGCAPRID